MCRDNAFAGFCRAFAGDIEQIAFEQVLGEVNRFVENAAGLTGLLDQQLTAGICAIAAAKGRDCSALRNIVLDGNGDMLLWFES